MKNGCIGVSALLVAAAVLSGCASTDELQEIRDIAQQARSAAANAQGTADKAMTAAAAADERAMAADRKADGALRAANEASNCCQANSEKLDRMFKKAMQK